MALPADLRTELIELFTVIVTADEHTVELSEATRIVGGCSRIQAVLAAREATFGPVMRRLEIRAAQTRPPASDDRDNPDETVDDRPETDGRGDDVVSGGDPPGPAAPSPPPPPVVPRVSAREQRRRDTRARWLAFFEAFAAAFTAGRVSTEHADVLAAACERVDEWIRVELRADEQGLIAVAERLGPEAFASTITDRVEAIRNDRGQSLFQHQLAESRAWMRLDQASGLYHLHAIIDPQRGELLQSCLDQRIAHLQADIANSASSHGQLTLQALLDLVHGRATVTPRALVVVDERTARTGMQHSNTVCENIDGARLPIDVALAACASGKVTAAILDRAGKPADLTTSQPLATAEQRIELRAMYRECVHPDCSVPFSKCDQHHVTFRKKQGASAVSNFVPACKQHHHDIHDRGWGLTINAERTLRWYRPDGTLYAEIFQTRLDGQPTSRPKQSRPTAAPNCTEDDRPTATGNSGDHDRPTATGGCAEDDRATATGNRAGRVGSAAIDNARRARIHDRRGSDAHPAPGPAPNEPAHPNERHAPTPRAAAPSSLEHAPVTPQEKPPPGSPEPVAGGTDTEPQPGPQPEHGSQPQRA